MSEDVQAVLDQRFLGKYAATAFAEYDSVESLAKLDDGAATKLLARFATRPGVKLKLRLILRELRQKEIAGITRQADNTAAPVAAPFPELDWTDLMGGETIAGEDDLNWLLTVLSTDTSLTGVYTAKEFSASYSATAAALSAAKRRKAEEEAAEREAERKRLEQEAADAKREAEEAAARAEAEAKAEEAREKAAAELEVALEAARKQAEEAQAASAAAAAASAAAAAAADAASAEAKASAVAAAAAEAAVPPAPDTTVVPPSEDELEWREVFTPEGKPYYHNMRTNAVAWDKPEALRSNDEKTAAYEAALAAVATLKAKAAADAKAAEDAAAASAASAAAASAAAAAAAAAEVKKSILASPPSTTRRAPGEDDPSSPPPPPPEAETPTRTPTPGPATPASTNSTLHSNGVKKPPADGSKSPPPAAATAGGDKSDKKKDDKPKKPPMNQAAMEKFAKRIEKFRCDKRDGKLVDHDAMASMKGVKKELDREKKEADKLAKDPNAKKVEQKKELSPQELAKKAAEEEEKRKRDEEEREKALQLLRGNRRTEHAEFLKMKLAANNVEVDKVIENDASEEQDDLMSLPLVTQVLESAEKKGILAKREEGFFKSFKPMTCVVKDGYLFWFKAESEKLCTGMVKVIKPSIKIDINDSVLEITDKNVTHRFRAVDDTEDVDDWKKAFRQSKVNKFHKKKASSIFAPLNMADGGDSKRGSIGGPGSGATSAATATKEIEQRRRAATVLCCNGSMFQKYKRGSAKPRMIWIPSTMDRILWGGKDKKVKGFIMITDVKGFASGCEGSKKPDLAFTVLAKDRNLELEAMEGKEQRDKWMESLKILCNKS